jgi:pimeloyl-ACP methyl ester carboxylesterase
MAIGLAALVLTAACSSDDDADRGGAADGDAESAAAPADDGRAPATPPEEFTGTDDEFYEVPDPLPEGEPGDLIRVQELGEQDGATTVRVMYHSVDGQDRDRAVTGLITYPTDPAGAPDDGWPVISWAHGTSGLATQCAPSRAGGQAPAFGVDGVRVATDYIGLGPVGERHPYLSGPSEAHSVIDGVRAARQLADAHAGDRWVAIGHSQGGHAALFANQLGQEYAPELDLRGTAALAPGAVLDRTFGPNDQIVPRMVGIMALYGMAEDNPDVDPADYVGPEVAAKADVIDTGCLQDIVDAFLPIPEDTFYEVDPLDDPAAREVLEANDPGHVAVDSPLLLVYGTADATVVPERMAYFIDQLCEVGQVTEVIESEGADHGTVVTQDGAAITRWLDDRLAGEPAPDSCDGSSDGSSGGGSDGG